MCNLFLKSILIGRGMEGGKYDKAFKMDVGEN